MAWQYDRPEIGEGLIEVFRRPASIISEMTFQLQGLEPSATYTVTNLDGGSSIKTGDDLMNIGLTINISDAPGSALIIYTKN